MPEGGEEGRELFQIVESIAAFSLDIWLMPLLAAELIRDMNVCIPVWVITECSPEKILTCQRRTKNGQIFAR